MCEYTEHIISYLSGTREKGGRFNWDFTKRFPKRYIGNVLKCPPKKGESFDPSIHRPPFLKSLQKSVTIYSQFL